MEPSAAIATRAVRCPHCQQPLNSSPAGGGNLEVCPSCRSELRIRCFPALSRASEAIFTRGDFALEGDPVCFFHPEKKAARSCDRCGRFVCALCDMPLGARHLCPSCVGSGLETDKVPELVNRRFVWGGFAFSIGFLPLLLSVVAWPFFIMTGPTAIFAGIWGWRKPGSIVRGRRRWAATLGIIGGLLQIAILGFFAFAISKGVNRG